MRKLKIPLVDHMPPSWPRQLQPSRERERSPLAGLRVGTAAPPTKDQHLHPVPASPDGAGGPSRWYQFGPAGKTMGRGRGESVTALCGPHGSKSLGLPGVRPGFPGRAPSLAQPGPAHRAVTRRAFTAVGHSFLRVKEQQPLEVLTAALRTRKITACGK